MFILGPISDSNPAGFAVALPRQNSPANKNKENKFKANLSREKLVRLSIGRYRTPIPESLLKDPQIWQFLNQNGIESLKDLNSPREVLRIRRIAKNLFKTKY